MTYYLRSFINAAAIVVGIFVLLAFFAVACTSCATEQATLISPQMLFAQATDTTTVAVPLPAGGKYKFKGPVSIILQAGFGNVATPAVTDNRKAGQHAQAVTTGPNSPVAATSKAAGVPWWVFLLVGVGSVVGWEYFSNKAAPLGWLPWRARPT